MEAVLIFALTSIWIWCLTATRVTGPGFIPDEVEWKERPKESAIFERDEEGILRYNSVEQKYMPDRSHFDKKSMRVVLKMDHYCPWLGVAIGYYNYKFFHQTVMYSWILLVLLLTLFIMQIVKEWADPAITWGSIYILLLASALTIYSLIIAFPFWSFHSFLIAKNLTTIEWMNQGSTVKWDTGSVWINITSVYGTNVLHWIFPIGQPPGEARGLYFHYNEDLQNLNKTRSNHDSI